MKLAKFLNIKGATIDQEQLERYLEKIASEHILQKNSNKDTYPIPRLEENFKQITKTYDILNSNLKLNINIHPAGEWLLDNYYIIEQTYKTIKKELSLKKYTNFIGIQNGEYKGFARIYVLANEIIGYTDGIINGSKLKDLLNAYQNKKTLGMEEIWNISVFLNISLIEKIRNVCDKIYFVQIQKYKVESIIERLVENKQDHDLIYKRNVKNVKLPFSKEPFIEYLSYRLNGFGKKSLPYLEILEEQVNKTGTTIHEIIKKEHFDIAIKKVSIGNCIKSIKEIQRINFTEIFEKINGVEEILKKDPANIYKKMTYKTKEYYRNKVKELSEKTKISEIYITSKILELANKNLKEDKKSHVGYYIIDKGISDLKKELNIKENIFNNSKCKEKLYIGTIVTLTSIITILIALNLYNRTNMLITSILFLIFLFIPISEIVIKTIQYILSKKVRPKIIPKIDFTEGITKENTAMVIMPTILKSKENVKEFLEKLEVYYLANKSDNIYFTLLGDCTTSSKEKEEYDEEIINTGKKIINELNRKYKADIFNFIYRKRIWNNKENTFLGWERKRGLIYEFNNFLLGKKENTFIYNSLTGKEIPNIKYIITLDSDTNLVLDSAKELVGAMAHILNKPIIDEKRNIVIEGYGIMQPRIGIDLDSSRKTLFTKIYAGMGGIDAYSGAISDLYQDNFNEGTFTGKGIYDLKVFNKVLENVIPENTVLSHDLLEGIYARCGLVTDVVLLDSYPSKFNSYITRLSRWIRGDWQIIFWLKNIIFDRKQNKVVNPIGELGKFKILDNLRRSLLETTQLACLTTLFIINKPNMFNFYIIIFSSIFIDLIIEFLNTIIFKKEGVKKQASFENRLPGLKLSLVRHIVNFSSIIYRALISLKAITITLYRTLKTKEHLLEWTTADEAEKNAKEDVGCFLKEMWVNVLVGSLLLISVIYNFNVITLLISVLWIIAPLICQHISKKIEKKEARKLLNSKEEKDILEIAKRTWQFFEDYLNKENNFLPPDNYQESRNFKVVDRTSSTNIGLAIVSVISAYDLKFIELEKALSLIQKMLETICKLSKWNGHLYNWYNIKTLEPLRPEYISTVDSGNFIGYIIILKKFLLEIDDSEIKDKYLIDLNLEYINKLIEDTDFSKLYNNEIGLFSIGFNIEENKLTDSYYDLLASEARQASLIAIAKRDVPTKHWNNLSRTLTTIDGKKGLVSWSGTAFEYLMPNINIKKYSGSLLDESCRFMIMSQMKYCEKLKIPWGISESAFNLKDLNANYQYKAFGIPWLGLKRGLADDVVVSSYGCVLAITEEPRAVMKNINIFKKYDMYGKYGLYESIDFTPERLGKDKKYEPVKTYMAHHQGLILLSINNLLNKNILQERFHSNPEIKAVDILLQEKLPEDMIITKERKEKVEKIKYIGNDTNYFKQIIDFKNELPEYNIISNEDYMVCVNKNGTGFSKYKNILINRYKRTNLYDEGVFFYFKNIRSKKIWSNIYNENTQEYRTAFTADMIKTNIKNDNIKTKIKTIIAPNDNVEIRRVQVENLGNNDEILEISSVLEPILSKSNQDYAHKAFNNLFLKYEEIENGILIKRNKRAEESEVYLAIGFFANRGNVESLEYEIDKEKLYGRLNYGIPKKIKESEKFSNNIGLVVDPIVSFRRTIKVQEREKVELNLIISVSESKEIAIEGLNKYKSFENVKRAFEISKIRNEENSRYLQVTGKEMQLYQKILSYLISLNPIKKTYINKFKDKEFRIEELWSYGISGDLPIILAKIEEINDVYVIKDLLKAFRFFQNKNITIDLVILNEEKNVYERYVKDAILREIANLNLSYLINNGIYILNSNEIDNKEILDFKANLIINAKKGSLENIIIELEEEYLKKYKKKQNNKKFDEELEFEKYELDKMDLKYKNGYGGFSKDGKEYVICVDEKIPSVWCNVLANENFGTIITQNLGGFTWYKNSRLNRISKWSNDSIIDTPSEEIFVQDESENKVWKLGKGNLLVTHGFGYSKYEQNKLDIKQKLEVFISMNDNVKFNILKLKNNTNHNKKINLIYKVDTVLDEDEIKSEGNIVLKYNKEKDYIYSKNLNASDIKSLSYIYSNEKIRSYTGNSKSLNVFNNEELNNEDSLGNNSCMAIKVSIELKAFEEKEISFVLGAVEKEEDITIKYKDIEKCKEEYQNTKNYWTNLLEKIKVKIPVESMNIILNGWVMYQTISSRLYARSGFNQSGGAFGFRDQLQDAIGAKFLKPEILKKQILKHASHQFIEGDAQHWWHDETQRGIRTRFSDDRLWLVYAIIEYVSFTGDYNILDIEVPYIEGNILKENEDEKYDIHLSSKVQESLYKHCIKAIEISLKFGENNLPLIGSGDWNDGFSTVGNKGKGESVWLGFFIYDILRKFIPIMKKREENKETIDKYEELMRKLKKALNKEGWDGRWYKRAYTDDGSVLGSSENEECKIDSISQSWAVLSEAGDNDKKYMAMESLQKYLINKEIGIIKLLDPPFEKGKLEPGYIKSYLPGVRENGGQYTHSAIWAIIAFAKLGMEDKAARYFNMINPIEHSETKDKADIYKIEPYVIPADIYGTQNLIGRGGWSWYTGSSSWYYIAGIQYILGLKIENQNLIFNPCIPKEWEEYFVQYKCGDSIYNIKIKNIYKKNQVQKMTLNSQEIKDKIIKLQDNKKINEIEITI